LAEIRSLLAAKLAKCYVTALEPGETPQTNLALNGVQDRLETIEEDASDKVDKLRFTTNIEALSRIITDDRPNGTFPARSHKR
jgi:hypothetical protein